MPGRLAKQAEVQEQPVRLLDDPSRWKLTLKTQTNLIVAVSAFEQHHCHRQQAPWRST